MADGLTFGPTSVDDGLDFDDYIQPPEVPPDPSGDDWRGPPGPQGPPGPGAAPADTPPLMDGTAAAGTANSASRGDHVHPSDTSRLPLSGGTMLGALTLSADPAAAMQPVTLQYFNSHAGSGGPFLPLTGGTVSGAVHHGANTLDGSAIAFTGGTLNGVSFTGGSINGTVGGTPTLTGATTLTGNTAATPPAVSGARLQITGSDAAFPRINIDAFNGQPGLLFRRADGTAASPAALASGSQIGALSYYGHDGTGYGANAQATQLVSTDGAWSSTSHPTRFSWYVTPVNSVSQTETVRLASTGNLILGTQPTTDYGYRLSIGRGSVDILQTQNFYSILNGITGNAAGQNRFFNTLVVGADNSTSAKNSLLGLSYTFGGANVTGNIFGIDIGFTMNAASAPSGQQIFYTAISALATASANAGGTGTDTSSSKGNLYGLNITPQLSSGATNFTELTGGEIDSTVLTGASVSRRTNLKLILLKAHAVQGAVHDSFLEFGRDPLASVGAKIGLTIGTIEGDFPIDNTTGIAIGNTYSAHSKAGVTTQLDIFVDASHIRALTAAWKSPGAIIDGSGNLAVGPGSLSRSATGMALSVAGQVGGTPTVNSGGAGAVTGQIVTTGNGDLYTVTASGGAVTALTVIVAATSRTTGPTGPLTVLGDGITGVTATIPWSNASGLTLQSSGGSLGFYGATPVVKQTGVAVTIAAVHAALTSLGLIAP